MALKQCKSGYIHLVRQTIDGEVVYDYRVILSTDKSNQQKDWDSIMTLYHENVWRVADEAFDTFPQLMKTKKINNQEVYSGTKDNAVQCLLNAWLLAPTNRFY